MSEYKSIQSLINHGSIINYEMLADYIQQSGFEEIDDYSMPKPGDSIKYIRKVDGGNDKFINSWVVVQNNPDYFLYKWYNGTIWSLQKNEIVRLWHKKLPRRTESSKKIVFAAPAEKGLDVVIGDKVVYRARDNYSRNRFMATTKYNTAFTTGNFIVSKK